MKFKKSILVGVLGLGAIAALTGCGGKTEIQSKNVVEPNVSVEIENKYPSRQVKLGQTLTLPNEKSIKLIEYISGGTDIEFIFTSEDKLGTQQFKIEGKDNLGNVVVFEYDTETSLDVKVYDEEIDKANKGGLIVLNESKSTIDENAESMTLTFYAKGEKDTDFQIIEEGIVINLVQE